MSIFTSVIKCGICGEPLSGAGNPYTCAVCGNVSYTSNPMLEDELRTANAMRECTRFDEAMLVYKQIVKKYKTDDLSEVYWNLLLCEQRVMFETDEKGERFPSFYAIVSDDVEDSPYYTCALSAAEKFAPARVTIFTEMAEKMARAKQLYSRIRESEKPYDVFICFKKSKLDGSGEETPDTDLAEDLYNQFAKDYRIFFSERTLRDIAVRDFEPNIYYALYTAKVLLLLCSKREYIDSKWVKNEWSRYHAMAQNPATGKTVIPVFLEDFEPGNLPAELLSYQGLADGRQLMGALENTLRKILKPLDMEAELNRRMQEMMAEQRRQNEEQQRQMQEQLKAMRKAQEQMEAMRKAQEQPKPAAPVFAPTPTPAPIPASTPTPGSVSQPAVPAPKPETPPLAASDNARFSDVKVGDQIKFGAYQQGKSNSREPIEWQVLDVQNGKALVISKYGLDCKQYHTSQTNVTWATCSLRKWLNNDFVNIAFSAEEKARISIVKISADKNPSFSTAPGKDTQDQVFLLSVPEVKKYFSSDSARRCEPTEQAVANGVLVNRGSGDCFWWLRSPGYTQFCATFVLGDGGVLESGHNVDSNNSAVRPALWIDLELFASCAPSTSATVFTPVPQPIVSASQPVATAPAPKNKKETKSAPKAAPATKSTSAPEFEIENGVLKKYNGKGSDVTVPIGVTTIASDAFKKCSELTKVTVPSGVTIIQRAAFHECTNLTEIVLPDTLKNLDYDAALKCKKLKKTTVPVAGLYGIPHDAISGELHITGTGKIPLRRLEDTSWLTKVSIEKGITAIEDAAFELCIRLRSVTLPAGLVSIGGGAFWKCDLRSVRIPKSVKSIGKNAFFGNGLLESVVFECEDAELGADLFWDCSNLREITCPASMEKKLKKQFGIFERKKINFIIK